MESNELRTGVLVYRTRNQWTLEKQKEEVVLWDESIWYRIGECTDYLECFSGIPLTLEWLTKFGFEGSSIIVNEYSLGWFTVQLSGAVKFRCNDGCLDKKIFKYVHELQNFYFAVTGNELECVGF